MMQKELHSVWNVVRRHGCLSVMMCIALGMLAATVYAAPENAKLQRISVEPTESGIIISLEQSKPPQNYQLQTEEKPFRLVLVLEGSQVAFKKYENIPIEFPVNKNGMKRIVVEEKRSARDLELRNIICTVEMNQPFEYETTTQWDGQYLTIAVTPVGDLPPELSSLQRQQQAAAPVERRESTSTQMQPEAEQARQRMQAVIRDAQQQRENQQSQERIAAVRQESAERVKSGATIEQAYQKLKAESEISTLPQAREQIADTKLFTDITLPSEIKPVLRRVSTTEITSLEQCIALAISRYPPLDIAQEQERLAALRVRESKRAFYPSLLAEWSEGAGDTIEESYRNRSYGFKGEQSLYSGGRMTAALRKEQLGELIAQGNLERIKQDMIVQVTQAYFELLAAKNTVDMLADAKRIAEKILSEVEKEAQINATPQAVLLTARSLNNQAIFQWASAERERALAKLKLEKEMFTENLDISQLDYRMQHRAITVSLDDCRELAERNRVEIKVLEQTIQMADYGEDIIRSESLPNVSVVGTYGRAGEAFSERDLTLGKQWMVMGKVRWFLGGNTAETSYSKDQIVPFKITDAAAKTGSQTLNAKFSFWDNLAHFSKQKEAQITKKQAEKDLDEMRNRIRQETEDAYYSYQKFQAQMDLSASEMGYRSKQVEIARTKRRMDEATGAEIMEAEVALAQATINFQQALAGINIAIAALNRAVGVINYFQ